MCSRLVISILAMVAIPWIARSQSGPLSPTDALSSMQVRPGMEIELVAAEPLVMDPVAFDWGPDGRLWVVEMRDYPNGLTWNKPDDPAQCSGWSSQGSYRHQRRWSL